MEFKHVLFSGLLMSATFVACTNEEFQEVGSQASIKDAISLGEGFTISGSIMNAQTRALYQDAGGTTVNIKSLWEPNDLIGAAWYAAQTTSGGVVFDNSGSKYFASNHPYEREDKNGNVATATFKTVTNSFAGKYVLYFPYNEKVNSISEDIPVVSETAQTMNTATPMAHVNKNMFFYANKEYITGGNQAADFELKPVPVLYRLFFKANDTTKDLVGKVISKVVVETTETKFYSSGKLTTTATDYSDATVAYAGSVATNIYTLDVDGNENDADYQVSAATADGGMKKPLYISILPAASDIESLTFKVITKDGAVFEKVLENDALSEAIKGNICTEGGLFSNNITLDAVGAPNGSVYTIQQFNKAWDAALKAEKQVTITLGAPLSLETLTMEQTYSDVKIEGNLTVGTLTVEDGNLSVADLKVTDLNVGQFGDLTTTNTTTIEGTLLNKGNITLAGVAGLNNVNVERKATLKVTGAAADKKIAGTFVSNSDSDVTLETIGLDGTATFKGTVSTSAVVFNKATTVEGSKAVLTAAGATTFKSDVTNSGKIANSSSYAITFEKKLNNIGEVSVQGSGVEFKGTTTNTGTVTVGQAVTNSGTFINRGVLTLNAALTNAKDATLSLEKNPAGSSDITNKGTVNVTMPDGDDPAALNVVNNKTLNINVGGGNKTVTFTKLTNAGIVNVTSGTVKETADNAITQTAGEIKLAKDAKLTFSKNSSHTALVAGYIFVQAASAVTNAANDDKIACFYADIDGATDATYVIIDKPVSLTSDNITALRSKNVVVRANIELQDDMEMQDDTSFIVEEIVTLKGKESKRTLSFSSTGTTLTVAKDKVLMVGENAKVDASDVNTSNVGTNNGTIATTSGEYTPKS